MRSDLCCRIYAARGMGNTMNTVQIRDEFIKLGQALKLSGIAENGADAKFIIEDGVVTVNGESEMRRGRKLYDGDLVSVLVGENAREEFTVRSGAVR